MIEPNRKPFWRYLLTPRGEATNLIILFLIFLVFGLSQVGYLAQQLADFYQTLNDKSFFDVLSLLIRFFTSIFCIGLSLHFLKEIYAIYIKEVL